MDDGYLRGPAVGGPMHFAAHDAMVLAAQRAQAVLRARDRPKTFHGAEYIGTDPLFIGMTALLIYGSDGPDHCRVQIDKFDHPNSHSWKVMPVRDWFIHVGEMY